jgi:hypothetical protein
MRKLAHGRTLTAAVPAPPSSLGAVPSPPSSLGAVPAPPSDLGAVPAPPSSSAENAPASGHLKQESAQFLQSLHENVKKELDIDAKPFFDMFENIVADICAEVVGEVIVEASETGTLDLLADIVAEECMEICAETLTEAKTSHVGTAWVFPWLPMDHPSGGYWKSDNVFENKPSYSLLPALSSGETVVADEKTQNLVTNEKTQQRFKVESRYWNLTNEEISEEPPETNSKVLKPQLFLWVETPRTKELMKTNSCVVAPYGLWAKDILECLRVGFDDVRGIQKPIFEVLEVSDKDGRRIPLCPDVVLNEAFVDKWGRDMYARAKR